MNKVDHIASFITESNLDICCVTETWFHAHHNYEKQCVVPDGYRLLNKDREGRRGGVLLLFVEKVLTQKC